MGRPKEHDERTGASVLEAAERIVDGASLEALSVRHVAEEVGTTTRAVYSVFGSKEGVIVVLGIRAFEMLGAAIRAQPKPVTRPVISLTLDSPSSVGSPSDIRPSSRSACSSLYLNSGTNTARQCLNHSPDSWPE